MEISFERVFKRLAYAKPSFKVSCGRHPVGELVRTGTVRLHRLGEDNTTVCVASLQGLSGVACPYCNHITPDLNKRIAFELYREVGGSYVLVKLGTANGKSNPDPWLTVLLSYAAPHYKHPLHLGTLKGLEYYPAHIAPQMESMYAKWLDFSNKMVGDKK